METQIEHDFDSELLPATFSVNHEIRALHDPPIHLRIFIENIPLWIDISFNLLFLHFSCNVLWFDVPDQTTHPPLQTPILG
jgi:hypothetical protein